MKRISFIAIVFCACFCFFNTRATAQENFTEGSVWRVNLIDIKPGKGTEFWRDLRGNLKPIWEEYKKAGIIVNYLVHTKMTTDEPGDWDVAVAFEYKNMAALDGLGAKTDPITLKAYGTADARREAGVKRTDYGTIVASFLMRNVVPKDLPK